MVYKITFKKRFRNKLEKTLNYIEREFGLVVAQKFSQQLQRKFDTLQQQPYIGLKSSTIKGVRSILVGKRNRVYYRIEGDKIVVLNMYDTRINPARNRLK